MSGAVMDENPIASRESELRYRRLFEAAQDGILILDAETGAITDVNPYLVEMLGHSREEFVEKKLWEVAAFRDIEASKAAFLALQEKKYIRYENLPLRAKNGRLVQVEFVGNVYTVGSQQVIQCNIRDITERKRGEQQLQFQALRDALTGLFNRLVFADRLTQSFERAKRNADYRYTVLFLDLDRFKVINDSLGHFAGDQLLIAVARRLERRLRSTDALARLGGDEFALLLNNSSEAIEAVRTASRIQEELTTPFTINGHEVFTGASIGIAESGPHYEQPADLLRDADIALYRAKALGGGRYAVFDAAMHDRAVALLQLETELRRALENQEFLVYYQPIVSLATEKLYGLEALVRWQHPTRGLLTPEYFLGLAEETGLINWIGAWVLRESCLQMQRWQSRFSANPPLTISVNLSHKQFLHPNLIELVTRTLQETGLAAQQLCLEITEDVISQEEPASEIIRQLHRLGVQLHVDDFGSGYSSLSALRHVEITALKIARIFVPSLNGTNRENAIARAGVLLAHELGLIAVAEGVETAEQLAYLKNVGCEYGQGYLFAKPMGSAAATTLLTSAFQPKD